MNRHHPGFREQLAWWVWSGDTLVTARQTTLRAAEVHHALLAVAGGGRVDVLHATAHRHRARADGLGIHSRARLTWGEPVALPRLTLVDGPRLLVDDAGEASVVAALGDLVVDDTELDLDRFNGVGRRLVGVVPTDTPPGPTSRPPDTLPQRLWFRALLPVREGLLAIAVVEDDAGRRLHGSGVLTDAPGAAPSRVTPGPLELSWCPGTRRLARAVIHDVAGATVVLEPRCSLPSALLGGLGGDWPAGDWIGDDGLARRSAPLDAPAPGLAGVAHEHWCDVGGLGDADAAIVEITALGPHAPSGLTGWMAGT